MSTEKVILELGPWGNAPYRVETMTIGGYRWDRDRSYTTKVAAKVRAEELFAAPGIERVRVVERVFE